MSEISVAEAMQVIKKAMQEDQSYADSWHDNIAVMAQDAGADYDVSNEGASRFMKVCFDVETKNPKER